MFYEIFFVQETCTTIVEELSSFLPILYRSKKLERIGFWSPFCDTHTREKNGDPLHQQLRGGMKEENGPGGGVMYASRWI